MQFFKYAIRFVLFVQSAQNLHFLVFYALDFCIKLLRNLVNGITLIKVLRVPINLHAGNDFKNKHLTYEGGHRAKVKEKN